MPVIKGFDCIVDTNISTSANKKKRKMIINFYQMANILNGLHSCDRFEEAAYYPNSLVCFDLY